MQPGAQLGRYRLDRVLGEVDMGKVFLACDTTLQRAVILKMLTSDDAAVDADATLPREARDARRMRSGAGYAGTMARDLIVSIRGEYERYKALGEGAVAQVEDQKLSLPGPDGSNSLAVICWHISGNLRSRFTDFLTSDGEKPWRNREEEFDDRAVSRAAFLDKWESGWSVLFATLDALTDDNLHDTVTIRGQALKVHEALHRSLSHTAYHVGQMVYVAKALRGGDWKSLSIPRGQSATYVPKGPRG